MAQARSFVPNPAWKNSSITIPSEERIAIAQKGIEQTLASMVDGNGQLHFEDWTYGTAGRFFSLLAGFDLATNQTMFKDRLINNFFPQALKFRPNFMQGYINTGMEHSIAATHAYTVYSDLRFLDLAELAWSGGRSFTLSEDELNSGKAFAKNFTFPSICGGLSMAGGTFWNNHSDDSYTNTLGTAAYLLATSSLAEATKNQTYMSAAIEAQTFSVNHLVNPQQELLDGLHADSCTPSDNSFPANYGLMIEGLAVLASITPSDSTIQLLDELVYKATVSHTDFYDSNGVLSADSKTQPTAEHVSQYMIRGLTAVYNRNTTHSDLRSYIGQYIGVQYNAVLSNARAPGTDIYAATWTGPPSSNVSFDFDSQTNALAMLVAAISLQNETAPPTPSDGPSPPPTPSVSPGPSTKSHAGAIAGGVVGGLAFIALLLIVTLYFVRRRKASQQSQISSNAEQGRNQPMFRDAAEQNVPLGFPSEKARIRQQQDRRISARVEASETNYSTDIRSSSYTDPYSIATGSEPLGSSMSEVPTVELLRVLNARIQPREWEDDEPPPDYNTVPG